MTKGDIVVCVDCTRAGYDYQNFLFWDDDAIRIGGQYEVLGTFKNGPVRFITIFNDKGTIPSLLGLGIRPICDYRGTRFKPLSEWREEKLNELGV